MTHYRLPISRSEILPRRPVACGEHGGEDETHHGRVQQAAKRTEWERVFNPVGHQSASLRLREEMMVTPVEEGRFAGAIDEASEGLRLIPESDPLKRQSELPHPQAEFLANPCRHGAFHLFHPERGW